MAKISDGRGLHFTGSGRFPRGVQKAEKTIITTNTVTATRKGDPQYMSRDQIPKMAKPFRISLQ